MKAINRYTSIKGTTIYKLSKEGKPASAPAAIDMDITIGEQSHPTTDIPVMGTLSVPDQSRLDNFTIEVNVNCDSPEAAELGGEGIVGWQIQWVDEFVDTDGLPQIVGWTITAKGYVTGLPEANKNQGSDNSGNLVMNVVSILKKNSNDFVSYDIDRIANRLIRNGVDYRERINALL